ncbi:hypothetical protein [Flavobacterium filum]|uniref:hypothetical protein n=1 Tax=Flavobacterium filum TaxID=370974 RepID=UPI00042930A3|nr:hypothetical protein [Flavobacterium filum]
MIKNRYRQKFVYFKFEVETDKNRSWDKKYFVYNKKRKRVQISQLRFDEALQKAYSYSTSFADAYFFTIKRYTMKFKI